MVSATTVNYPKVATKDETAHSEQVNSPFRVKDSHCRHCSKET